MTTPSFVPHLLALGATLAVVAQALRAAASALFAYAPGFLSIEVEGNLIRVRVPVLTM